MSLDIGATETFTADTITYANAITLDGTLNLDGTVFMTDTAEVSASGTGEGIGTAESEPTRYAEATGIGRGYGYLPPETVADVDTKTVTSEANESVGTLFLDGTLALDGTLNVSDGLSEETPTRFAEASGEGRGLGSAEATPTRYAEASGTGEGTGEAKALVISGPLRRKNSTGIDNTRRDEFDTQGTGDVDD